MSAKKRQTMAKMTRERAVQERRARKQERKEERKQAAAIARDPESGDAVSAHAAQDETGDGPSE
ncbi:MAG: hypothetical protein ABR521_03995 [Gaiellaceae bacterium]